MIKVITALAFSLAVVLLSVNATANTFFSHLKESEVQAIFDRSDKNQKAVYLTNNTQHAIPAVQILPISDTPNAEISATTSCIKLYSCNQGICLVGIGNNKFATSEQVLNRFTQLQVNTASCAISPPATASTVLTTATLKSAKTSSTAWYKVIKVKANDSLNMRQKAHHKGKKVAQLAYNANCIKRLSCKGKWCEIEHNAQAGWVHKNYLAPIDASDTAQCL